MLTLEYATEMLIFLISCIVIAWFSSQAFKAILNCTIAKNFNPKFFIEKFFADGDFPSSHTCFSVTGFLVAIPYAEEVIASPEATHNEIILARLAEFILAILVFVIVKDAVSVRGSLKKLSVAVKSLISKPEDFLNDSNNEELQSFWTDIAKGINVNVGHMPHEVIGGVILAIILGVGANSIRLSNIPLLIIDIIAGLLYIIIIFSIFTNKKKFFEIYNKLCAKLFKKKK